MRRMCALLFSYGKLTEAFNNKAYNANICQVAVMELVSIFPTGAKG